jgi:hypothetical protein
MAEDEYALTRGKIVTFIGILCIITGLMGIIFLDLATGFSTDTCMARGSCNFDIFPASFFNNLSYNLSLIALVAFGILFIFIGRHLDKN